MYEVIKYILYEMSLFYSPYFNIFFLYGKIGINYILNIDKTIKNKSASKSLKKFS